MKDGLFSVLVASYNNGRYLSEAIDSVIAQTYQDWEMVIVDDASTDDSVEIIKRYISQGYKIRLYRQEKNQGCGATKRRCAELAEGAVCGFLDPDDALTPDALQIMMEAHYQQPEASLISSRFYRCNELLDIKKQTTHQRALKPDENYLMLRDSAPIVTHFATFKTAKYRCTSGIDAKFKRAVDQDLYYKMEEVGNLVFIDLPLYKYRIHKGGISLFDNANKALYWHIVAMVDAGIRRGIDVEDVVQNRVERILLRKRKKQQFFRVKICPKQNIYRLILFGITLIDTDR
ncbi:MAG: glycosyltransferase [Verrucomicrobiales bacterium]|nr:glycosyltransferase [Verrucomicrobiales bacterium]